MRVAVLSDVHGFSLALEAVIADVEETGPYDAVVVAGDHCEVGPAPREALDRLRSTGWILLKGNTDDDLVEAAADRDGSSAEHYAIKQLGPDGIAFLAELPFSHRVTPPGGRSPGDDLLVVHANPHDLRDQITDEMSDRAVREVLGDERPGALAFGHYHVCFVRRVDDTLLVDVSAVGNPKDRDLRCKYGVLTWDETARRWSAELRKLAYPLEATHAQILASDLPNPEKTWKKLKHASYRD